MLASNNVRKESTDKENDEVKILIFLKKSNLSWHRVWGLLFLGRTQATEAVPSYTNLQKEKRENLHESLLFRKVCKVVRFFSTKNNKINRFLGLIAVGSLNRLLVHFHDDVMIAPNQTLQKDHLFNHMHSALHICYMDFSSIFKNNLLNIIFFFLPVFFRLFEV